MSTSNPDLLTLQAQLTTYSHDILENNINSWANVESDARSIANTLAKRLDDVDIRTQLGQTSLPQTITLLLKKAQEDGPTPPDQLAPAVNELLRTGANVVMNHTENRSVALEAGFPQTVVLILEGYVEQIRPLPVTTPIAIPLMHLTVIKAAIGFIINVSLSHDEVKRRLISLEAASTILKLSSAIYPTTSWVSAFNESMESTTPFSGAEWTLRSQISSWAWRAITELKENPDDLQIFDANALPLLTTTLRTFIPPYPTIPESPSEPPLFDSLAQIDFDILEESCTVLESLSLDVEEIRHSLYRGWRHPDEHNGVRCFANILDFIEFGSHPPSWKYHSGSRRERNEKTFAMCKGALIKSIVEVAGEKPEENLLWDWEFSGGNSDSFVGRMVNWIRAYLNEPSLPVAEGAIDRSDLVICAALSLGNLVRNEQHGQVLSASPISIVPIITSNRFLQHAEMRVKHAVISLLKNLTQASRSSSAIRSSLNQLDIVPHIIQSGIWDEAEDLMANVVQQTSIAVVRNLASVNVDHAFAFVLPTKGSPPGTETGLRKLLKLINKTNSPSIKTEGSRTLAAVVKSLWSLDVQTKSDPASQALRQTAMNMVLCEECAAAISQMVSRSAKYTILINEGILAMSFLSTTKIGAELVLSAILSPTPEPGELSTNADIDPAQSRTPTPWRTLDQLAVALDIVDEPDKYPPEIRLNVCSFLLQLQKNVPGESLLRVRELLRPVLDELVETLHSIQGEGGKEKLLQTLANVARRVLDNWSEPS